MAGFADRLSHPAFMWLTQAHTSRSTPDEIRLSVLLTAYGLVTSGTTAAIDHFPGQRFTATDMDAVLSAWEESGMRVALGMRFFDGAFSDIFPRAPIPDDLRARMAGVEILKPQGGNELRDLMEDTIKRWHGRGVLSVYPAPSNPDRCTDGALVMCAELAQKYDTGIHTHLLETERQAQLAAERYGHTAVKHLDTLGVLSARWSCAHCNWLTDDDIDLMAGRSAVSVLNPESNAALGTGRARAPEMQRRGLTLRSAPMARAPTTISCCTRRCAPSRSITAPASATGRAGSPRAMLCAWRRAAARRPCGSLRLGAVAPGFAADLVLYRLDAPWWVPLNNPVNQLVFAETGASVDTVMIDGKVVLDRGRITTFDVDALLREVRAMALRLRDRNADLFAVADDIVALVP